MNKLFSDAQLKSIALEHFKKDANLNKVYATVDGNVFLEKNKNHAINHAKENKLELKTIERPEEEIVKPIEAKLEELSLKALKEMCDGRAIAYTSKTSKQELIELIQEDVLNHKEETKED